MRIHLLCVGTRMPRWVQEGYQEYASRMPRECAVHLREVSAERRTRKSQLNRLLDREAHRLLAAAPPQSRLIALDERGDSWSTRELARHLQRWMESVSDVALLVGGPDGLAPSCLQQTERRWSLSRLTLSHYLVRVLVAEQLYRAWTLTRNHPYHRD